MPTVRFLCLQFQQREGSTVGISLVRRWINKRVAQILAASGSLEAQRRSFLLTLPATLTDGLVTTTQGSPRVEGNADASAAWAAQSLVGRFFRVTTSSPMYRIIGQSPGILLLEAPYADVSLVDSGYEVIARVHELPADARNVAQVVHEHREVVERTPEDLARYAPGRWVKSGMPVYWAVAPRREQDAPEAIEVYPVPAEEPVVLRVEYFAEAVELGFGDLFPRWIDLYVIENGVLSDVCEWEAAEALRRKEVDVAAVWTNKAKAYESRFARDRAQAVQTSTPGLKKRLFFRTRPGGGVRDITSARDEVELREDN